MIYEKTTQSIKVQVRPIYLNEHSIPAEKQFVWAYEVLIENNGDKNIQLLNRYWSICDAKNIVQEVRGPGVVGAQPKIKVGESYTYSSFTVLETSSGSMRGKYEMVDGSGNLFDVEIPKFKLNFPCRLVEPLPDFEQRQYDQI